MTEPASSKYLRLADDLQQRICQGHYAEGDRLPPIRQMAVDAGVSLVTMTRAMQVVAKRGLVSSRPGGGTIVTATREPYNPRNQRVTGLVGFVLAHHAGLGRLDQALLGDLQTHLRTFDKRVEFDQLHYPFDPAEIQRLTAASWEGIVLTGGVQDHHVAALRQARLPFIVAGSYRLTERCDQARYDVETSVASVYRRMFASGLRRIGVIVGRSEFYGNRVAADALEAESRLAKVPFDSGQIIFDESDGEDDRVVERLMESMGKPDGLWASGNVLAPVLRGLDRQKIVPHRDITLVGIRNRDERIDVPFSYELRFQHSQWAASIVDVLLDRLKRGIDAESRIYSLPMLLIEPGLPSARRRASRRAATLRKGATYV